jgi:hypothetical protein
MAAFPCRERSWRSFSGVVTITVSWAGTVPLDATLVTYFGDYIAVSEEAGYGKLTLSGFVEAGAPYEVRVNSYYSSQAFELTADLYPASRP